MREDIKERNDRLISKIYETLSNDYENIKELKKEELIKYCNKYWIKENHSAATIKHYLYFINNVLKEEDNKVVLKTNDFKPNDKNIVLSKEDVINLIKKLENAQDQAFIYCLFKNIYGAKAEELIKLEVKQVDISNKKIYLKNRIVEMDDMFTDIMQRAINQKIYHAEKEVILNEYNQYVFKPKPSKRNHNGYDSFSYDGFVSRIRKIRDITGVYITPDILSKSGAVDDLINLYGYTALYDDVDAYCKKEGIKIGTVNLLTSYRDFIIKNKLH